MAWNRRTTASLQARPAPRQGLLNILWRSVAHALGAGVVYWSAAGRHQLHWSWQLTLHSVAVLLSLRGITLLITAVQPVRQQPGEKDLSARQRRLFGLPIPAAHRQGLAQPAERTKKEPEVPSLGPPRRHPRPIASSAGGQESGIIDVTKSPLTPHSAGSSKRRTASPYSNATTVTTPEQLQRYLDAFEEQTQASAPEHLESFAREAPATAGLYTTPSQQQPFGAAEQNMLQYRPSLQARGRTGSPLRSDGVLTPSSQETFETVLSMLQADKRTLEVWTDRFREWLAAEVLQPLVIQVKGAHVEVATSARQLGWNNIDLTSLGNPETGSSNRGLEADEELQINLLREALTAQLRSQLQEHQQRAVLACLQAVINYQRLAAILRGEQPRGLLPPVPRGYIICRLQELAQSSCISDFTWNSGGSWQGRPWTAELITDSALLFYLFGAFLEAPKWYFPLDGEVMPLGTTTAPLYIGSLPSRPAHHCTALLPVRPPSLPPGITAVLALSLASKEPHFTLVMQGEPVLTLCNYTAAMHILLLFTQCAKLSNFGALGGHSLEYLRLAQVLRPADAIYDLLRRTWFGLW